MTYESLLKLILIQMNELGLLEGEQALANVELMGKVLEKSDIILGWLQTAKKMGLLNAENCQVHFDRVCSRVASPDFSIEPFVKACSPWRETETLEKLPITPENN
ncbi:MAG: hypothetical protein K0S29_107 [Gammaproteobacteria bacterium]|jgi:hypothetical protein|nr:hypothetical protein [Gammaproteobacteria bacterium]